MTVALSSIVAGTSVSEVVDTISLYFILCF